MLRLGALFLSFAASRLVFGAPASSSASNYGCLSQDSVGHSLLHAHKGTFAYAVSCEYDDSDLCYYKKTGTLSSGPTTCPHTISTTAKAGAATIASTAVKTASAAPGFNGCPAVSLDGHPITKSTKGTHFFAVACYFGSFGVCWYDKTGQLKSGPANTCPSSITSPTTTQPKSSSLAAAAATQAECAATDSNNGKLLSTSTTSDGFVACVYESAGTCEYFATGGTFSSGSSTCPKSAPPSNSASSSSSTQCPPHDGAGGLLLSSGLARDGFVECEYEQAGTCEYFGTGGSFSSGSSTCPASIPGSGSGANSASSTTTTAATTSTAASSTSATLTAPSASSSASSGLAQCVSQDDTGSPLLRTQYLSDEFVLCQYASAGSCHYFTPGGQFADGASTCPNSITPSSSSSTDSGLAQCVSQDDTGAPLLRTGTLSNELVICQYAKAGSCDYFTPGGQFAAGASTCPDSITPGSSSSSAASSAAAPSAAASSSSSSGTDSSSSSSSSSSESSSGLAVCVSKDDTGSALLSSGTTSDGFVTCQYATAGNCEYFSGGQFSAGASTCPDSITPGSSSSSATSSSSSSAASSSSGIDGAGLLAADMNSSSSSSSASSSPNPIYIALIVMNGILVVGVLVIGFIWVRQHRVSAASKAEHFKVMYAKVDAARDDMSMPFTVPRSVGTGSGSGSGSKYYDPHDPQARYAD